MSRTENLRMRLAAAGLALLFGTASLAHAQQGSREAMLDAFDEAQEVAVLTVPFNPPVGTAFDYKLTVEKKRPRGDRVMEFEQTLTFGPLDNGFALALDNLAISIAGQRVDLSEEGVLEAMPMALRPFIMSLELELDASGEAMLLRDWPSIKGMLAAIPEEVRKQSGGADRDVTEKAIDLIFGPLLTASAQEAPQLLIQGWTEVLGYGGLELEDGEIYEAENQIEGGLLPGTVPALTEVSLSKTPEGDYQFVQTTKADPEAFRAAMLQVVDQLTVLAAQVGNGSASEDRAQTREELIEQVTLVDAQIIVFDAQTGLPKRAQIERSTHLNGEAVSGNIITITQRSK